MAKSHRKGWFLAVFFFNKVENVRNVMGAELNRSFAALSLFRYDRKDDMTLSRRVWGASELGDCRVAALLAMTVKGKGSDKERTDASTGST